jgi:hypothetical protein
VGLKPVAERLTLITSSLPDRSHLLAEMQASVAAQTVLPAAHLIVVDDGPVVSKLKRLEAMVDTEYWCQVDDDDLLYPNHVEVLSSNLDADVVWTWCDVTGRAWNPNQGYEPGVLQSRNYIPANYAGRAAKLREVGGNIETHGGDFHDWNLLRRLEANGATFKNVPIVTWQYRFGVSRNSSQ